MTGKKVRVMTWKDGMIVKIMEHQFDQLYRKNGSFVAFFQNWLKEAIEEGDKVTLEKIEDGVG